MPEPALDDRFARLVARLRSEGRDSLVHHELVPGRAARFAAWPPWTAPEVRAALAEHGVPRLWSHQQEAAEAAHSGRHVVVATGTASGKSLGYLLPALTDIVSARGARGQRGATALYLSPTKALAHDQATAVQALGVPGLRVGTHDGDCGPEQRAWNRDHAEYLLTNPDMLHHSLLPGHERWARFWRSLRYVVVDECHHYRGIFGAHVAQVLRRLRRVCGRYGAEPTFVLASATISDPGRLARRLTGLEAHAVTRDGSPHGERHLLLWEPPLTGAGGENGAPVRRPAAAEAADLLADLVIAGVRTLAFVRSRQGVETVALAARRALAEVDPGLADRVAAYRGGYLPEERRELEGRLRTGQLLGVAATQALELGIDVSGLDAIVQAGYPGTRAAFWQQLGRAGREGGDSLGMLVAREDPLDTYLVHHPEALLGVPVEEVVCDVDNPHVLGPHLCAAAAELPLTEADLDLFGPLAEEAVAALTRAGMLRRRPRGWFWTDRRRATDLADLRSTGGPPVRLVEEGTGRVLGTVDRDGAQHSVHDGAVHLHQGETWLVSRLDLDESVATVARADPDHTTSARETTDLTVLAEQDHLDWPAGRVSLGQVRVTHQVVSYLRRRRPGGEVIGEVPLDLPARTLDTVAVWWSLPADVLDATGLPAGDLPGAAHAAEHASIGLLPLVATCDRWDVGGVSTALHPDTGTLTVFVYDGHPGGAGFAERGYAAARHWWTATRDAITACECVQGCPSCVQSPKCGNQNQPLDKAGAVVLLDTLLQG